MTSRRYQLIAILAFFTVAMVYPLAHVVTKAFLVGGKPSLHYFVAMIESDFFRDVLCNSLNLAIGVTLLSTLIAYPISLAMCRYDIPARGLAHSLILLPLISPPFVGVLGVRQLFSRFGSVNVALLNAGLIDEPIRWLGSGNISGIIALQTIHLVPILYLTISASLKNAHVSLEEAARVLGSSRWRTLRRVVLPLSLPGWFAGASLVFIASFTDLGTPLVFEFRSVIPVQIYNMLTDLNENPVGYSFVVLTCTLSIVLFFLSRAVLDEGAFASSTRTKQGRSFSRCSPLQRYGLLLFVLLYGIGAAIPQLVVILVALAKDWFLTTLPTTFTLQHFASAMTHPLTTHSLLTSVWLSLAASVFTMIVGYYVAYLIARGRGFSGIILHILSVVPLAVPGIVFAFGYVGAFAGTWLDNRINPFPLLLAAYSVRRIPAMVRSADAGLQEASPSLEEAAVVLGASPFTTSRRIILPLISRHLLVGAVLTFAYSMIEVSDSLLLAMEAKFYPVSKAIYTLMARPDGMELASALGSIVMAVMFICFYGAEILSQRADRRRIITSLVVTCSLLAPSLAQADSSPDELIAVSPHWEGIKKEFEWGFAGHYKAATGRDVTIRWLDIGGTSDIVKYLKAQHKANPAGIGIDIVFGGGTDAFLELQRAGTLLPMQISPQVKQKIPAEIAGVPLYAPNGEWYVAALSIFGIIANAPAVERLHLKAPEAWADLARPEYFDLVGLADPRKSGSMHAMYEVILQGYGWAKGWELLAKIAGNARAISGNASQVGKDVSTGEMVFGIAIDTYAGDIIRKVGGNRIVFIRPKDFSTVNGDAIAALASAPHPETAKAFIEFILSEDGQKLWYYKVGTPGGPQSFEIGKLPILPALYSTGEAATVAPGNPFTWENVLRYDPDKASARWNIVNDLFGAFVVDVHDRLASFSKRHPATSPPLPLITEREAEALSPSGTWGEDQLLRNKKLNEWGSAALAALPIERGPLHSYRWLPSLGLAAFLLAAIIRRLSKRALRRPRP